MHKPYNQVHCFVTSAIVSLMHSRLLFSLLFYRVFLFASAQKFVNGNDCAIYFYFHSIWLTILVFDEFFHWKLTQFTYD